MSQNIDHRNTSGDRTENNILDIIFIGNFLVDFIDAHFYPDNNIVAVFILCISILMLGSFHCMLMRRRRVASRPLSGCHALKFLPTNPMKAGNYTLYEVELAPFELKDGAGCAKSGEHSSYGTHHSKILAV